MDKSRILKIVEFGYLIYALVAGYVIYRIIADKIKTSIGQKELTEIPFSNLIPLIALGLIALAFIVLILVLAYFLNKRIHRIASLVLAVILALSPPGILLGIVAFMLLTRKDIQDQFTS